MKIDVLGTTYKIRRVNTGEDVFMDRNHYAGYCDAVMKEIAILNLKSTDAYKDESPARIAAQEKETIRHELVHAFLDESGLRDSTLVLDSGWAGNEEMVDWIALMHPKLHAAFEAAGAL